MSGYTPTAEDDTSARAFTAWFNALEQAERQRYQALDRDDEEDSHEAMADWVNSTPGTTIEDYDRVTELHSMGIVEIGDDAHAHYRS